MLLFLFCTSEKIGVGDTVGIRDSHEKYRRTRNVQSESNIPHRYRQWGMMIVYNTFRFTRSISPGPQTF